MKKVPENPDNLTLRDNGRVLCPQCNTLISVGKVGLPNYYECHRGSAQCTKNKKKWKENEIVKRTKSIAMSFFGPRPSKVPATVTAPPPIQPASFVPPKSDLSETLEKNNPKPIHGCPFALQLLAALHKHIESLPKDTKEAGIDHPLAGFSIDPTGCVEDSEDAWEEWDGPLNMLLQKDPEELNRLVIVGQ